jgi:hypothetical protein
MFVSFLHRWSKIFPQASGLNFPYDVGILSDGIYKVFPLDMCLVLLERT